MRSFSKNDQYSIQVAQSLSMTLEIMSVSSLIAPVFKTNSQSHTALVKAKNCWISCVTSKEVPGNTMRSYLGTFIYEILL